MLSSWWNARRRRALLATPFPRDRDELLLRGLRHYRRLPADQRGRVQQIATVMLAEKEWAAAGDWQVPLEVRLLIAAQAAVMVSGLPEPFYFDRLHTIVVHRGTVRLAPERSLRNSYLPEAGVFDGIAWQGGPVVISWRAFDAERQGFEPGRNVVLHEFAHHLDALDGSMDGLPALGTKRGEAPRLEVTEAEFLRLVGQAQRDEATLLDHYGATNRAEFFAVATECFFELPHQLRDRHGELYQGLREFYRQDPATWLPPTPDAVESGNGADEGDARPRRRRTRPAPPRRRRPQRGAPRLSHHRGMSAVDGLFTLALDQLHNGQPAEAVRLLTQVLQADPQDEEALAHRAIGHLQLDDLDRARADCEAALALDPDDVDALCVRGELLLAEGKPAEAITDLSQALALTPGDPDARLVRAEAWLALAKPRKAIRDLDDALASDPYFAEAHLLRGAAHEALGRRDLALLDAARARLIDPAIDDAEQ